MITFRACVCVCVLSLSFFLSFFLSLSLSLVSCLDGAQTGKIHFGYIYGFGIVGCIVMYFILNLMSDDGIDMSRVMSVLGYCLLPIVLLSAINVVVNLK